MQDADVGRHGVFPVYDDLAKDETNKENTDVPRRKKIIHLVNIVISALFAKQDIAEAYLQDRDEQITMSCMPSKETYKLFPYQLEFILMSNQVLRSIHYEGQVAKFIPMVKPTTSQALLIDSTTLYALFCSSKLSKRMYLQDFKGNHIKHKTANVLKYVVYGSFFSIDRLKDVIASYGMGLADRMHICPGSKTVRLYGSIGHFRLSHKNAEDEDKRELMVAVRDAKEHILLLRQEIRAYGKPLMGDMKVLIPFKPFVVGSKECCRNDFKDVGDAAVPKTQPDLPRALTLGLKQIGQNNGLATFTNSLNRKKKITAEGHSVLEIEEALAKNGLHQC
ncbi:hypothetical protein [Parasitella parasitica]|uniref:Uncharacterized protein n=1 Tax=Parasitella parasitica TaxID=35722 RepID=A0A0B7NGZ3_9FUNG|nr:hypothetical protein [Parasitella parasitica]